jgi:uncharacterized protein YjbI with pentapeptide repeats
MSICTFSADHRKIQVIASRNLELWTRQMSSFGRPSALDNRRSWAAISLNFVRCAVSAATLILACPAQSLAKPTRQAILSYSDQCKADGIQMDLIRQFGTDFSHLDLSGLDLRGVYRHGFETLLVGADFSGSNLQQCDLSGAILDSANFAGADLSNAKFTTASLRCAKFLDAKLSAVRFYQCQLDGAILAKVDLSQATITGSSFTGADLSFSKLTGARNEYWWSEFEGAKLNGADLTGLKLAGARFQLATLQGAILRETDLRQADFSGTDLTGADLTGANVKYANFSGAIGLDDDTKGLLVAESNRSEFESRQFLSGLKELLYWPGYFLVLAVQITLAVKIYRTRGVSLYWICCSGINGLALIPLLVLGIITFVGGSPVAQFNVGTPFGLSLWRTWAHLWPVFLLGVRFGIVLLAGVMLFFLVGVKRRQPLKAEKLGLSFLLLTLVHLLFLACTLQSYAPDA